MIATTEGVQLIDEAMDLAKMISQSDVAKQYQTCKYMMEESKEVQVLRSKFLELKDKYDEVQRFGRYHPDYNEVSTDVRIAKRELDLHELVANFRKAERNLEDLLTEVSRTLAMAVSKNIIVPSGNPFFDNQGCSGGCGSGGSCNCG